MDVEVDLFLIPNNTFGENLRLGGGWLVRESLNQDGLNIYELDGMTWPDSSQQEG